MWDGVITHNLILYYDDTYLADVIANDFVVVDVKTTFGPVYIMADVIAIVADVIATTLQIGLYCNGSWCYC